MAKRRKPAPPLPPQVAPQAPRGILELDRFSEATLNKWHSVSQDLDELQAVIFFGLEPERRRLRQEILAALASQPPKLIEFKKWARIVTYQYSTAPLSCAGSLQYIGGRFNAGIDLDANTLTAWPALYLAEDYETAYREKFQLASNSSEGGLSPEELSLEHLTSHSALVVHGKLTRVFDMTLPVSLNAVADVFRRIKMPVRARELKKKLLIPPSQLDMAKTAKQIHNLALDYNWRVLPIQFGMPAPSHILAELIRAAGFEAIAYQSTKGPGQCLAVFPDLLEESSFVELSDPAPSQVEVVRLDVHTADVLAGWESVPRQLRNR